MNANPVIRGDLVLRPLLNHLVKDRVWLSNVCIRTYLIILFQRGEGCAKEHKAGMFYIGMPVNLVPTICQDWHNLCWDQFNMLRLIQQILYNLRYFSMYVTDGLDFVWGFGYLH